MTQGIIFDDATAKDIIAIVRHYRRNGFPPAVGSSSLFNPSTPTPIYVHNESGGEIPAYACMQVTGTEEIGGRNFLLVDQPADTTGDAGWYLFNGPNAIADNEEGVAQSGNVVRGYKNTGTVTAGDRWQPVASQWYIEQDDAGPFIASGGDDVADDVLRVFVGSPSSHTTFFRFTLNASLAGGTADADILDMDGVDTGLDATVRDPLGIFATLTTVGDPGICVRQGGKYWVIQAPCP